MCNHSSKGTYLLSHWALIPTLKPKGLRKKPNLYILFLKNILYILKRKNPRKVYITFYDL